MDEKYEQLRAALDAATPGPWKASEHQWPEQVGCCPLVGRPYSICGMDRKNIAAATSFGTAVYIAACHPEAIRALLADYDRMRVALTTIKEWPISSPLNMDAYNMAVVAQAALAQGQEEA